MKDDFVRVCFGRSGLFKEKALSHNKETVS